MEGIPEWLETIVYDFHLFEDSECKFIVDVYWKTLLRSPSVNQTSCGIGFHGMRSTADNFKIYFQLLIKELKKMMSNRCFQSIYNEWRACRDRNVMHLRKIANSIDQEKQECEAAKFAGSMTSLIGGAVCLAVGGGVIGLLGKAITVLGQVATVGTSFAEERSLKTNIDRAHGIMITDKQSIMQLLKFLDDINSLQNLVDKYRSIDYNGVFESAAEGFEELFKKNLSGRHKENEMKAILKGLPFFPELNEEIAGIVGILLSVSLLLKRHQHLLKLVHLGISVKTQLGLSWNSTRAGGAIAMNSATAVMRCGQLKNLNRKGAAKGMALDALSIFLAASKQETKSIEAEKIREVADKLEDEALQFDDLYEEMKLKEN